MLPSTASPLPFPGRFCLIHGPRKGGTTLLQSLLDSADGLMMRPGELKLKRLYVPRMMGLEDDGQIFAELSDWYNGSDQYYGDLGTQYRAALDAGIAAGLPVHQLVALELEQLRVRLAPDVVPAARLVIAFKEVGGRLDAVLQATRLLFPRLKVVLICRSPLAVSSAIYRSRRRRGQRMGLRSLVQQALEPWQVLLRQMRLFGCPGLFFLSYESLVQDPPAAAGRLERFLELPAGTLNFEATTLFGRPTTSRTASRDTSRVFLSEAPWQRGLVPTEILLVLLAMVWFRLRLLCLAAAGLHPWLGYRSFARAVEAAAVGTDTRNEPASAGGDF
ncbi:MAG: sulfotransferase [Synechococcaceae cyanobacterium]|nr:sulfotransferase [Synechococcaceae cyanobacterium]